MPNLGPTELIIILVIVVIIFGAGKLTGIGGALGTSIRDFRSAMKEGAESDEEASEGDDAETAAASEGEPKPEPAEEPVAEEESQS